MAAGLKATKICLTRMTGMIKGFASTVADLADSSTRHRIEHQLSVENLSIENLDYYVRAVSSDLQIELDANDARRDEISSIIAAARALIELLNGQLIKNRQQMRVAARSGMLDERRLQPLASQRAQIIRDMAIAAFRLRSIIREIESR